MTLFVLAIFTATYAGMALGVSRFAYRSHRHCPGGKYPAACRRRAANVGDRRGDRFPTLFILFGLMILSAQFAAAGFYDWCALRIARARRSPLALLAVTVVVAGGLSAVLANDVVVFAMTPMLCVGLKGRGLDPRPSIALAGPPTPAPPPP